MKIEIKDPEKCKITDYSLCETDGGINGFPIFYLNISSEFKRLCLSCSGHSGDGEESSFFISECENDNHDLCSEIVVTKTDLSRSYNDSCNIICSYEFMTIDSRYGIEVYLIPIVWPIKHLEKIGGKE